MGLPPLARYPALFQLNTRVTLTALAGRLGRPASLDDLPDELLAEIAEQGFDIVWLLGVWQTGPAGRTVSATDPGLLDEYRRVLPDFVPEDVVGSCFAVSGYHVHADFGGDAALARLRERLRSNGLRLMLDFVPNHVGLDHSWRDERPDFFVSGTDEQLAAEPRNWMRLETAAGSRIVAHGRDPYFPGWSDTLQLDYSNPDLQAAMLRELRRIAAQCDGLRCDMAMLVLPDIFERTWGCSSEPFWPAATATVKAAQPGFVFMAEVYWDLESTLIGQGFDYAYDKRLYDRLRDGQATPVRDHLRAGLHYQDHLARFLENHDEPRAAATFAPDALRAAAVLTYLTPGLRFFHQGQREGRRAHIPVHLRRGPSEPPDPGLAAFYDRLLDILREPPFRDGQWQLLDARPAWAGNPSNEGLICFAWSGPGSERRLVAVNYAPGAGQAYLDLPWADLAGDDWRLTDLLGDAVYERFGSELVERGLYLDLGPWAYNVFRLDQA